MKDLNEMFKKVGDSQKTILMCILAIYLVYQLGYAFGKFLANLGL